MDKTILTPTYIYVILSIAFGGVIKTGFSPIRGESHGKAGKKQYFNRLF